MALGLTQPLTGKSTRNLLEGEGEEEEEVRPVRKTDITVIDVSTL
jgi:hypothetical protein